MNNFFGDTVVEKLKLASFNDEYNLENNNKAFIEKNVTINKYQKKIDNVKNEKIKKSLFELTKVFREK